MIKKGVDEKTLTISILEEKDLEVKTEISLWKMQHKNQDGFNLNEKVRLEIHEVARPQACISINILL